MWLIIAEVVLLLIVLGVRLIFKYLENKKIKSILKFIESRADNNGIEDRLRECIDIINQNKKDNV